MKNKILAIAMATAISPASANNLDACGAILCLSHGIGSGIPACAPYLAAYFSIDFSDPLETARERLNFLNSCEFVSSAINIPGITGNDSGDPAAFQSLKRAIVYGAGHCDPEYLAAHLNALEDFNSTNYLGAANEVSVPQHCIDYANHSLTAAIQLPYRVEEGNCRTSAITWSDSSFDYGGQCRSRWVAPPPLDIDEMMQRAREEAEATLRAQGLID